DAALHRLAALFAGDAHEAAQALHDDVERGPVRVRTIEAKSCQSDVDQTGVCGQQRPGRESELIHRAGPQILADDVGVAGESPKDLAALRVLQIYGDRKSTPL